MNLEIDAKKGEAEDDLPSERSRLSQNQTVTPPVIRLGGRTTSSSS